MVRHPKKPLDGNQTRFLVVYQARIGIDKRPKQQSIRPIRRTKRLQLGLKNRVLGGRDAPVVFPQTLI